MGGDHITNDIALGFGITRKRGEHLKREAGSAILESATHFQRLSVPAEMGFPANAVAVSDLNAVIHARVDELFQILRHDFEKKRLLQQLGAGIVLTGGGARLRNIPIAAERVFEIPCAIGKPKNFSGVSSAHEAPEYAALLGMLRYAVQSGQLEEERISLGGLIRSWLGWRER